MATTPSFSQPAIFSEVSTPTVPDSGYLKVYGNSGALCSIANGGTEKSYVAISGSGLPIGAYTLPTTDGTASQVLQTNGSGVVTWETVSGGISSLNSLTGATQTFATGTSGTNFAISSSGTAHTFDLPDASASARGLVTTGSQTFAGGKTFADISSTTNLYLSSKTYTNTDPAIRMNFGSGAAGGIYGSNGIVGFAAGSSAFFDSQAGRTAICNTAAFAWANSSAQTITPTTFLYSNAANTISQRNSTNAQTLQVFETYTSSTSLGTFQIKANSGAEYQIGSAIGSAGGSNRNLHFGMWNSVGAFSTCLRVTTSNTVGVNISNPSYLTDSFQVSVASTATTYPAGGSGNYGITINNPTNTNNRIVGLQFGGYEGWTYGGLYGTMTSNGGNTNGRLAIVLRGTTGGQVEVCRWSETSSCILTQWQNTSGSPTAFIVNAGAHTTLAAGTEAADVNLNIARTVQFATGALTTQRAVRIQAPTYAFVATSTIATAATLSLDGAPVAGTNATITNSHALLINNPSNSGSIVRINASAAGPNPSQYCTWNGNSAFVSFLDDTADNPGFGVISVGGDYTKVAIGLNVGVPYIGFGPGDAGRDIFITRDAAGILHQRNSTNAQTFRVYNTWTSSTSFEAGVLDWRTEANTLCFGTIKGSAGGSARQLKIVTDGIAAITVSTAQAVTMSGNTTSQGTLTSERYGGDAWFRMRRANGTVASPTQVVTNNTVGSMTSNAYHSGGAFHTTPGGAMYFVATEDATATAQGTEFRLFTTANGGTTNTRRLTIGQDGTYTIGDACNFAFNTSTGTKLGTATTQKIGFWNATPVVQQTTAVASATVVGASGTTLTDADTFDGYSLAQVVKALRNLGILA